jgi:hypothetical protein
MRLADRRRRHVALRQEVAPEAVGNLAGVDPVVLLFSRSDRAASADELFTASAYGSRWS